MKPLSPVPLTNRVLISCYAAIVGFLKPEKLFGIADIRRVVARYRFFTSGLTFRKMEEKELCPGTGSHTIEHNEKELQLSGFQSSIRSARIISIISSLPRIYEADPALLRVLSIGPRTEMEIMSLLSFGFNINNIDSIDLISSSPHIRVGDMHDPDFFPLNCYDVILLSWVLNYSSRPEVVLNHALKSLKSNGIIALANTHTEQLTDLNLSSISSVDDLVKMIPLLRNFTTLLSVNSSKNSRTFMYIGQAPD